MAKQSTKQLNKVGGRLMSTFGPITPNKLGFSSGKNQKQLLFERETLSLFKSFNRLSYDKRYKEKYGIARKSGSEDFLIRLSLLLRGVKNDDYTMPEVIFLRDCFLKRVKKDQLSEAKQIVDEINEFMLNSLRIKGGEENVTAT